MGCSSSATCRKWVKSEIGAALVQKRTLVFLFAIDRCASLSGVIYSPANLSVEFTVS